MAAKNCVRIKRIQIGLPDVGAWLSIPLIRCNRVKITEVNYGISLAFFAVVNGCPMRLAELNLKMLQWKHLFAKTIVPAPSYQVLDVKVELANT
jgi:hypothetical protein